MRRIRMAIVHESISLTIGGKYTPRMRAGASVVNKPTRNMSVRRWRTTVVVPALAAAIACHAGSAPPATTPAAAARMPAAGQRHTHENLNAVLWVQTAAEYRASALQAYRLAQLQLDAALDDPLWTAATEQTEDVRLLPPAVILDLD